MEMPLGYASMNIGRVLNLYAQQVSPACCMGIYNYTVYIAGIFRGYTFSKMPLERFSRI